MKYRIFTSVSLLVFSAPAYAQVASDPAARPQASSDQAAPADATTDDAPAAEITVTGSRIRGAGPVGSNVISVSSAEISRAPVATITEFLRKVPQVQGFGVDASSPTVSGGQGGTNTTRGSSINLRGVGPQATLTLIDGQRFTYSGVSSNYVDASAIPAIAIERIEVVPDGASAVYGSDAVAGVANFILRKKFDGLKVTGRYGFADGYWLAQAGIMAGKHWGSGDLVLAFEHSQHDNLNGGERSFNRSDLTALGGKDYRNSQCNPGNIVIGGVSYAIPSAGVTPATAASLVPGTRNLCENLRYTDILPKENRSSIYGSFTQELAEGLKVHVEGIFTHRKYTALGVQQGSTSNILSLTVPNTNPYFTRPVGSTATSETVEYDFTPLIGLVQQHGYTGSLFVTGGLDWNVTSKWHVALQGFYTSDKSYQDTRRIDSTVLTARLRSADPTLAFNPYGGSNSQAVLDAIYSGVFNPFAVSRTRGASIEADGSLFALPGGDIRLAAGAEYVRYTADAGNAQGSAAAPTVVINPRLARDQKSAYAELFVPVFGAANEVGGLHRLDVSAAIRYDHYNDTGGTTNPKIGVNWSPVTGLLFKGSYGTSFRAPGLQDLPLLRSGSGLVVSTWTDPLSPTGTSVGLALNAGNPNLKPETATTWSLTAEVSPPSVPGLRLSATYFSLDYRNLIGFPPRNTNSLLDPNYAFAVTRNPSAALIQSYVAQGILVNGALPATVAFLYDGSAQNLGSVKTTGLDFDANYQFDTSIGAINVGANGSYVFDYKFAVTQVAAPSDQAGNINYPVNFRARGIVGWSREGISAELTGNFVSGYTNNLATPAQKVGSWTTADLNLSYTFAQSSGALRDLSVGVDINNVFDTDPPFVNILGGWDSGQASALGRVVVFSVSKKF